MPPEANVKRGALRELAQLFLRLGASAFGGPAAHVAMMAFVFVAASGPLVPRLRRSAIAGAFLDGVNVASLALMAFVTWQLGRSAVRDLPSAILAVTSAVLLLRYRVSSSWLVAGGAVFGLMMGGRP